MLLIFLVKCPYFEILIVLNRPYLAPHTIPYNVFKLSKVPLVNLQRVTQRVTLS